MELAARQSSGAGQVSVGQAARMDCLEESSPASSCDEPPAMSSPAPAPFYSPTGSLVGTLRRAASLIGMSANNWP